MNKPVRICFDWGNRRLWNFDSGIAGGGEQCGQADVDDDDVLGCWSDILGTVVD